MKTYSIEEVANHQPLQWVILESDSHNPGATRALTTVGPYDTKAEAEAVSNRLNADVEASLSLPSQQI